MIAILAELDDKIEYSLGPYEYSPQARVGPRGPGPDEAPGLARVVVVGKLRVPHLEPEFGRRSLLWPRLGKPTQTNRDSSGLLGTISGPGRDH